MAGSIAAAAKSKLVGTGNALQALLNTAFPAVADKVIVAYEPPRDYPPRMVFGGDIGGPIELESFGHDTTNRVGLEEHLSLQLYVRVYQKGQATSEAPTAAAIAIAKVVIEYIALDGTLGGVTNLVAATVDAININSGLDDDGATCLLSLTIGLESHLT